MLPPGTALQQGNYILDALIEAAPNGYLYLGTQVVAGSPVYIQVTPLATALAAAERKSLVDCLQGLSFAPTSPLPTPFQIFLEGEHQLCWVVGKAVGLPWSQGCPHAPLPPKQALITLRAVAESVLWLSSKGLPDIDLSPNRLWLLATGDRIALTGIPQTQIAYPTDGEQPPRPSTVQALARLLHSLLLGEVPPAIEAEALVQTLKDRLPELSPLILQAIRQGENTPPATLSTPEDSAAGIRQWLASLPDTPVISEPPSPARMSTSAQVTSHHRRKSWPVYPALAVTALLAALAGSAAGTFWRFNADALPGAIQFDPSQSFPPQAEWTGDNPEADFDTPYVSEQSSPFRRRQEDWLTPEPAPVRPPAQPYRLPAEFIDPAISPDISTDGNGDSTATETRLDPVEDIPAPGLSDVELEGAEAPVDSSPDAPEAPLAPIQESEVADPKVAPERLADPQVVPPDSAPSKEIFSTVPEQIAEPVTGQEAGIDPGLPPAPERLINAPSPIMPAVSPPRSEG